VFFPVPGRQHASYRHVFIDFEIHLNKLTISPTYEG
jgi:hypothetical protein